MDPEKLSHIPRELRGRVERYVGRQAQRGVKIVTVETPSLDFDDIRTLDREIQSYTKLVLCNQAIFHRVHLLESLGADNDYLRRLVLMYQENPQEALLEEANFFVGAISKGLISEREFQRVNQPINFINRGGAPTLYLDAAFEDVELFTDEGLKDIPLSKIVKEGLRIEEENLSLLQEYLAIKRQERKRDKKDAKLLHQWEQQWEQQFKAQERRKAKGNKPQFVEQIKIEQPIPDTTLPAPSIQEERPILSDWKLFITTHPWSDTEQYLVPITSSGPSGMTNQLQTIVNKEGIRIPIKVSSVVGALRFHLEDKTRLQRTLSLRNKYEHPEWSKIKRGAARILCKIVESEHTCIFFAGHRKEVYQSATT